MAVQSFYCALCGIKLSPEQARAGRPSLESLTTYCATCVEEKGIAVVQNAPPFPSTTSGRLKPPSDPTPSPRPRTAGGHRPISDRTPPRAASGAPSSSGSATTEKARGRAAELPRAAGEGALVPAGALASALPAAAEASTSDAGLAPAPLPIVIPPAPRPRVLVVERGSPRASQAPLAVACAAILVLVATIAFMKGGAQESEREAGATSGPAETAPRAAPRAEEAPSPPVAAPRSEPAPRREPPPPARPAPAAEAPRPAAPPKPAPAPAERAATAADIPPAGATLVGNANTKKVHGPTCRWGQKISDKNRVTIASLEEAKRLGFEPCGECEGRK
jgi:hypothetical protein